MDTESNISIHLHDSSQAAEWKNFLSKSNNGTLFHDLEFLAYHAPDRFRVQNLLFYECGRLIALLPAAVEFEANGRQILKSPYGASIGGFVLSPTIKLGTMLQIVKELQRYAEARGLAGLELRIGPNVYLRQPDDLVPFSLMKQGFTLTHRWFSFIVPIEGPRETLLDRLLSKTKRYDVRTNLRNGLEPREVDAGKLPEFFRLWSETYGRLETHPTHSREEIADLIGRFPGRVRVFLCAYEGTEIAAVLVFRLNDIVANTFYICESEAHKKMCGPAVLIAHIIERLATEGIRYLDLGPSASDSHFNKGVVFFKEGFGARGFCRETWRWECDAA